MPFHLPWSLYLYDLDFSYLFNAEEQLWKKSTLHLKTVDLVLIPITYVRYFNTSFKHDSNMTPRLSAHFSIFSLIFLEINFLLGIATQWICKKIAMISLNHRVKLELKKKMIIIHDHKLQRPYGKVDWRQEDQFCDEPGPRATEARVLFRLGSVPLGGFDERLNELDMLRLNVASAERRDWSAFLAPWKEVEGEWSALELLHSQEHTPSRFRERSPKNELMSSSDLSIIGAIGSLHCLKGVTWYLCFFFVLNTCSFHVRIHLSQEINTRTKCK